MNPGWEIRYIEYSSEQLKNYEDQNDEILAKAGEKQKYSHVNFLSDEYRRLYLNKHTDELIVYCDLDCFPIAPFDNFFLLEKEGKFSEWISRGFCKNIHKIRTLYVYVQIRYMVHVQQRICIVQSIFIDRKGTYTG